MRRRLGGEGELGVVGGLGRAAEGGGGAERVGEGGGEREALVREAAEQLVVHVPFALREALRGRRRERAEAAGEGVRGGEEGLAEGREEQQQLPPDGLEEGGGGGGGGVLAPFDPLPPFDPNPNPPNPPTPLHSTPHPTPNPPLGREVGRAAAAHQLPQRGDTRADELRGHVIREGGGAPALPPAEPHGRHRHRAAELRRAAHLLLREGAADLVQQRRPEQRARAREAAEARGRGRRGGAPAALVGLDAAEVA